MATVSKRRHVDGGLSWDAMVRVRGYPTQCKSFRTRLEAEASGTPAEVSRSAASRTAPYLARFLDLHR